MINIHAIAIPFIGNNGMISKPMGWHHPYLDLFDFDFIIVNISILKYYYTLNNFEFNSTAFIAKQKTELIADSTWYNVILMYVSIYYSNPQQTQLLYIIQESIPEQLEILVYNSILIHHEAVKENIVPRGLYILTLV